MHARPDNQHEPQANPKRQQRPHDRIDAHQPKVLLGVFPIQLVKGFDLGVLLSVGTHDTDTRDVLLRARRDLRKEVLDMLKTRVHLLAEELNSQRDQRHRHEQEQRQLPIHCKQNRQNEQYGEKSLQAVHDHRPGELSHCRKIVRRAGHQIAGAVFVKKREGLIDQSPVEILAQVVLDIARHADDDSSLQKQKQAAHRARTQNLQRGDIQF